MKGVETRKVGRMGVLVPWVEGLLDVLAQLFPLGRGNEQTTSGHRPSSENGDDKVQ